MIAKQTDSNPAPSRTRRPAAFFDRDGVLNVDHGYVHRTEQLEWVAGAPESVRLLNEAGYYVLVITNQSGVARGFFDEAAVKSFHAHMQNVLGRKRRSHRCLLLLSASSGRNREGIRHGLQLP